MLQKRVALTQAQQISLAPPTRLKRLIGLRRRAGHLKSNASLLALVAVIGQLAVAYAALSPAATAEPDGGSTMRLLLPYSAMILGFLSSYWGLWKPDEKDDGAPYSPRRAALAERKRLIASLLPTIMGGLSMLLPMFMPPIAGVIALILGFLVMFGIEKGARRVGMPAANYQGLRWTIGFISIAILLNVATVRVWDFSLFF